MTKGSAVLFCSTFCRSPHSDSGASTSLDNSLPCYLRSSNFVFSCLSITLSALKCTAHGLRFEFHLQQHYLYISRDFCELNITIFKQQQESQKLFWTQAIIQREYALAIGGTKTSETTEAPITYRRQPKWFIIQQGLISALDKKIIPALEFVDKQTLKCIIKEYSQR